MEENECGGASASQEGSVGQVAGPTVVAGGRGGGGISRRALLLVAAAAGMAGTFLPWVHAPVLGALAGTQGDGWITLAIFTVALAVAIAGADVLAGRVCIGCAGAAAAAVGVYDATNIWRAKVEMAAEGGQLAEALASHVSVGVGLYLVIFGGLVVALGALWRGPTQQG